MVGNDWESQGRLTREAIAAGIPVVVNAGSFAMIEIAP
jgi:hypothetical protein